MQDQILSINTSPWPGVLTLTWLTLHYLFAFKSIAHKVHVLEENMTQIQSQRLYITFVLMKSS